MCKRIDRKSRAVFEEKLAIDKQSYSIGNQTVDRCVRVKFKLRTDVTPLVSFLVTLLA